MPNRSIPARVVACALVALVWLLVPACDSGGTTGVDKRARVLQSLGESVIIAGYDALGGELGELHTAAQAHCADPNAANLETAQAAYRDAHLAWDRVVLFKFGPHVDFPDRLGVNLWFFPVREDNVLDAIAGTDPLDADALASAGAAKRGLTVLEYLLWNTELADWPGRRCDYLVGAALDAQHLAYALRDAWLPVGRDYLTQMTNPGMDSMYMDLNEAVGEIVNRMGFAVENIRETRLGVPVGDSDGGTPHPESVEKVWAGDNVESILATLDSIDALFHGVGGGLGLANLGQLELSPGWIDRYDGAMANARAAVEAIPRPLSTAVVDDPQAVRDAIAALGELQVFIQTDLINVLGLALRFNDNDGD